MTNPLPRAGARGDVGEIRADDAGSRWHGSADRASHPRQRKSRQSDR